MHKITDIPITRYPIRIAYKNLKLKYVIVLKPGTQRFPSTNQIEAVPVQTLAEGVPLLDGL